VFRLETTGVAKSGLVGVNTPVLLVFPLETNRKNDGFGFCDQLSKNLLLFFSFSTYILWINIYRSFCMQITGIYDMIQEWGRLVF